MGTLMKNGVAYGGGSGGTSDYDDLSNKPSIENITLSGNKSASDLGLAKDSDLANVAKTGSYNDLKNKPTIPSDLDDMSDVELTTPTDGQVLKYNSTSGKWENGTGGGGSYTAGDGISIENDEISIDPMPAEDVDEVIDIYPTAGNLVSIVNAFNRGDIYSTDEKMIGQWVDGKPLYQKTIDFGALPNNTSKTVAHNITNYSRLIDAKGYAKKSSANGVYILSALDGITRIDAGLNNLEITTSKDLSDYTEVYVTLQYTKTTDTAISIGEATEYSTEEKIVGTWIDGKPIYQKTIQGVMPTVSATATASTNYAIGANVDTVVDANGVFKSTSEHWTQRLTTLNDTFSNGAKLTVYDNSADSTHKNKVYISSNVAGWNGFTCYITIQYIKKTT